jgi:hypothetical protein
MGAYGKIEPADQPSVGATCRRPGNLQLRHFGYARVDGQVDKNRVMRRINSDLEASELPDLDLASLSKDHLLYLRHMLGLVQRGDMFHGRFVEVHVGNLLGADIADRGINGWDLRIGGKQPITVEVKAAALGRSYQLGSKEADVWVFVTFADKTHGTDGYRYCVATKLQVAKLGTKRINQSKLFQLIGEVERGRLRAAVDAAATAER